MSSSNGGRFRTIKKIGKPLPAPAREIISNVIKFLQQESKSGLAVPIRNFRQRAIDATGVSDKTYRSIMKEAAKIEKGESNGFVTPKRTTRKTMNVEKAKIIRELIHNFYVNEKRPPTIHGLMSKIKAENIPFDGSNTALWLFMRKIGFQWASTKTKWKVLIESNDSRYKRIQYLRKLFEYRQQGRCIIYIDERYIDGLHAFKIWQNHTDVTLKKQVNRNRCLVVIYAGGEIGFIPNGLLMSIKEYESNDCYHINHSQIFLKWVEQQLLPNLPPRSVLVIDNHTHQNIDNDELIFTKNHMIEWLQNRHVTCNVNMTKAELNTLINKYKLDNSTYKLNELLENYGHCILKLPIYHPELSPITELWDSIKNWLLTKNLTFKMEDIHDWIQQKFDLITKHDWLQFCHHVDDIEQEYMKREEIFDKITDELQLMMERDIDDDEDDDNKNGQVVDEIMEVEEISDDESEELCSTTMAIKKEVNDDGLTEIHEWKPPVNVCTIKEELNSAR